MSSISSKSSSASSSNSKLSTMQRNNAMDERSPLLQSPDHVREVDEAVSPAARPPSQTETEKTASKKQIISILAVLLIGAYLSLLRMFHVVKLIMALGSTGVFLSNADSSIVFTTHALIASEFDDLSNSSWIFVSFGLAATAAQPLIGKLSDLFGRKSVLLSTYALFIIGCAIMTFLFQVPVMIIASILAWFLIPEFTQPLSVDDAVEPAPKSKWAIFRRLDFIGSFFLTCTILLLMFPLELGGQKIPWSHPLIFCLLASALVTGVLFIKAEKSAKEPVLPLELFRERDFVISFLVMTMQLAAQASMMFTVPLYFQITDSVSSTKAGAHLLPAVVGNAISQLISGEFIGRTGKYKALITFGTTCTSICYVLMLFRWKSHTNFWESLYIIPGGFGTGIAASALFIAITACVEPSFVAIASSTMYLSTSIGALVGLASSSAVLQTIVHRGLQTVVGSDFPNREEFIRRCLQDIEFLQKLHGPIKDKIIDVYVLGFRGAYIMSLSLSAAGTLLGLFMRERPLV
ncbi:Major facilitator superfamily [Lasiodiplodia theobromae]|nr:Major facilitator superfamily [Lasiodiplodia theobromae]